MMLRTLHGIPDDAFAGARVLLRFDGNVAVGKGKVLEPLRLRAIEQTICYLTRRHARVLLLTHLGRPNGKYDRSLVVAPVQKFLSDRLGTKIVMPRGDRWLLRPKDVKNRQVFSHRIAPGSIGILENIRFSPYESKNQAVLAAHLASLCDIYIFDAFAVAHRSEASVSCVAPLVRSAVGLVVEEEVGGLERLLHAKRSGFISIIGGAKFETKIPLLRTLLKKSEHVLLGGIVANYCLAALGYGVGISVDNAGLKKEAHTYANHRKIVLPLDVVVGGSDGSHYRCVPLQKKPHLVCKKGESVYDIGPATIQRYARYIKSGRTLLWNGTMGAYEQRPYHIGTQSIAQLVATRAKARAFGVVGGGETVDALEQTGMSASVDLVSTGGGAMLSYVAGQELPGLVHFFSS